MVKLTPEIIKQFATPFNENNTLGYKIPYHAFQNNAMEYLYFATIGCYNAETEVLYFPRRFDHRECARFVIDHTETDEIEGNQEYIVFLSVVCYYNISDISKLIADETF